VIPAKAEPIKSPVPLRRFRYDPKHAPVAAKFSAEIPRVGAWGREVRRGKARAGC
jgi:hypothetical protein